MSHLWRPIRPNEQPTHHDSSDPWPCSVHITLTRHVHGYLLHFHCKEERICRTNRGSSSLRLSELSLRPQSARAWELSGVMAFPQWPVICDLSNRGAPRNHGWKVKGDQGFGSQHRGACAPHPAKGRAGCWVRVGVAPSRCEGPGVSPPENFWKLRC